MVVLISCDKRKDYYGDINEPSDVNIALLNSHSSYSATINEKNYKDTLKLNQIYKMNIALADESNFVKVVFLGDGALAIDSVVFASGDVACGMHLFEWTAVNEGLNNFVLKFTDVYGVESIYNFQIFVFENKTPVTSWELFHVGNLDPLEKKIVVTGEDGDQIYGGNILYYEYVIGSDTTFYPGNQFFYVFPSAGNYTIGVRAMDSNYEWGNQITINNFPIE